MVIIQITSEQLSTIIQSAVRKAIGEIPLNNTSKQDDLLSVEQTAELLNLAVATIYVKVQRKELPVCKRGGRLYFSKSDLIDFVKGGRRKTQEEIEAQAESYVASKKKKG